MLSPTFTNDILDVPRDEEGLWLTLIKLLAPFRDAIAISPARVKLAGHLLTHL